MPSVDGYKHRSVASAWRVSDEICSKLAARSSSSCQFVFVFVHAEHYNVGVFQNGEVLHLVTATNATLHEHFGDAIVISKNASRAAVVEVHLFDDGTTPKTVRNVKTWAPAVRAAKWCQGAFVEATVVCDTYDLSTEIIQQHVSPDCNFAMARADDIMIASDDDVLNLLGCNPHLHAKPVILVRSAMTNKGRDLLVNNINANVRHAK